MKIRVVSDLHTEHYTYTKMVADNGRDFHTNMMIPKMEGEKEQVLVLAGDICMVNNIPMSFFKDISDRFRHIVYVPGNHESYRSNIRSTDRTLTYELYNEFSNITVLNKETLIIDGVFFIGGTLWTNFNSGDESAMILAENSMNDYKIIGYGAEDTPTSLLPSWTPRLALNEHEETMQYFSQELKNYAHRFKTVVVSHHGPSHLSCHEKFAGSNLNHAFYSHLDEFILEHKPDVWIHGHTHSSHDYEIGKTRVVVNPHGYGLIPKNENQEYHPMLVIEV